MQNLGPATQHRSADEGTSHEIWPSIRSRNSQRQVSGLDKNKEQQLMTDMALGETDKKIAASYPPTGRPRPIQAPRHVEGIAEGGPKPKSGADGPLAAAGDRRGGPLAFAAAGFIGHSDRIAGPLHQFNRPLVRVFWQQPSKVQEYREKLIREARGKRRSWPEVRPSDMIASNECNPILIAQMPGEIAVLVVAILPSAFGLAHLDLAASLAFSARCAPVSFFVRFEAIRASRKGG